MDDKFSIAHFRFVACPAFDICMRAGQRERTLNIMTKDQGAAPDRSMAARTINFSLIGELPGMRVGMAVCTFSRRTFITAFMTARAFYERMLSYQRE